MKTRSWRTLVLATVLVLSFVLPAYRPAPLGAAPPPPPSPTPVEQPDEPVGPLDLPHEPPLPGQLSPEVEQAKARAAMEGVLSKYLDYWGPRYQVAPIEVAVEGEWAHGVVQWQSEKKASSGPIHILARRSAEGTWQALMPSVDGLYLHWSDVMPQNLLDDRALLRTQAIEVDASRQSRLPSTIPLGQTVSVSNLEKSRIPSRIIYEYSTVTPVPSYDERWLEYINVDWGYKFSYPEDWRVDIVFANGRDRPFHVIRQRLHLVGPMDAEITIDTWQKKKQVGLLEWIGEYQQKYLELGGVDIPSQVNAIVDGHDALVLSQLGDCTSPQLFYVYVDAGDRVLLIQYNTWDGGNALKEFVQVVKKILIDSKRELNEYVIPDLVLVVAPSGGCDYAPNQEGCCGYPQITHWQCSRDLGTNAHRGNCTYWAAYKRPDIGSAVGSGHAGQWALKAESADCSVDTTPRVGDIMVSESMGHVAYVTGVGNGRVYVTEMKWCTSCPDNSADYLASGKEFIHSCGDNLPPTATPIPTATPSPTATPPAGAWRVDYYNDKNLGSHVATAYENSSFLDHDWDAGDPGHGVGSDNFSLRYERDVYLEAGDWKFTVRSDDGFRLFVDGNVIAEEWWEAWHDVGPTTTLSAGNHRIRLEYFEAGGDAKVSLRWDRQSDQPPAGSWKVDYYNDRNLSAHTATANEQGPFISRDWGTGGPGYGVGDDDFSIRYERDVYFDQAGEWKFTVRSDDGFRLFVDDVKTADEWWEAWHDVGPTTTLSAGNHRIRLEYFEAGGDAKVSLRWDRQPDQPPAGAWKADYYNDRNLGPHVATDYEDGSFLDHDWGTGGPGYGVGDDDFSIRYERDVYFDQAGEWKFTVRSDDGFRLFVDNVKIADEWWVAWHDVGPTRTLSAGNHRVKLEYFEAGGNAKVSLDWQYQPAPPTPDHSIQLYKEPNYGGNPCNGDQEGVYLNLDGCPGYNDQVSSFLLKSGWSVRVFEHNDLLGGKKCFTASDPDLSNDTLDSGVPARQMSSFRLYHQSDCPPWVTLPAVPVLQDPADGAVFDEGQEITLSWSATGDSYYGEVWGDATGKTTFGWRPGTSENIGSRAVGDIYHWHIIARNGAGASGFSDSRSFRVRPAAPVGLSARVESCSEINLSWTDRSASEEGYRIYRNGSSVHQTGAGATSYRDAGLSEDTEYTYWVKAFSGDLESNASNTTTVRTSVCPPADTEPPVVNWVAPASNTQTYHVRNETIRLEVEATDNVGVTRVRFYRWDAVNEVYVNIGYDDMPPYQFDLDCTILNYEWNQIFVQAFDAVGHVSERKWIFLFRDRPQPDLVPSQWQDWQYPIVPASITGTNVVNTLYAGYPTFIDWGISNLGDANSGGASYGDLYIDNVRKTHYDFGDILSGQLWAFFDWQEVISTPGWHTLKVVADPDNLVAEFDETNNVWEHSFYWVPSAPYHDDMENGANSWTAAGLWHRIQVTSPYRESHSGSRSWWYGQEATGDYDTGSDHAGGLTSPLVYIPSAGYYMRFWYWYETETYGPDWDQRWVQISVDGGPFNDVLQLANDPQGGWFESAALDLSGYAGQAIQIRFRFDSLDASLNDYRGWYIDDLNITTAPPPNCADSHEPNNVASQAATIAYGQTLEADICPKSDWDFYAFDGKAGDQVVIDIDAQINGSPLDPYVFLLDSDGESILAENDDEILGEVRDSRLAYHLNQDGTYYVKVRAWNHPSVGDPNHLYTIRLVTDNQSPPQASIQTPQSGAWLDHNLQTLGVSASDHESGIDRVDFFWHSADWENSDWIWLGIDIDGRDGWGLDLDTSAWVEQKGGALYIWAFDWANNWTGTGAWNLGLDRTAPAVTMQAGQYYSDAPFQDFWISWNGTDEPAGVASYDVQYRDGHNGAWIDFQTDTTDDHAPFVGENEHSYFFRARARDHAGNQGVYMSGDGDVQHTVQICDTPPDAYEPDGTVDSAGGLTVDGGSQTHTIHAGEDEDWVKFYAVSGVLYTLATTNTGGHADTVLELYGTDGSTLIASNDDDPTRWPASRLDWLPSATGMYYARVYHWDQWAYGCTTEYGLSIQTDDQTPPAGSVRINSGDMYAESRSVTLHLGGTDEGTGVGSLMASNYTDFPDAVWIAYSPTLNWTLTEGVGNKTVYVKYRDRAGNVSSVISDDIIYYEPVTANFSADATHGSAPLAVHFQDRSSGPVAAWGWSFGDGQTSTLQNPTHTYARDGSYEVTLTVRLAGQAADYPRGTDTLSRKDYIVTSFRMYLPLVLWYR